LSDSLDVHAAAPPELHRDARYARARAEKQVERLLARPRVECYLPLIEQEDGEPGPDSATLLEILAVADEDSVAIPYL